MLVHVPSGGGLARRLGGERVPLPSGFPWAPNWSILRRGPRAYDATIDVAARMIVPATTRYLSTAGSDAANGLSWAAAKRSMAGVMASLSAAAATIYVAAGDYRGALGGWGGGVPYIYQDVNIIAVGGRARFSISPSGLTWAANVTYPSVYQVTTTAPYVVIDEAFTVSRIAQHLTSRASVELVDANPGSWHAAAGVLYVRTADSRAPDASIHSLVTGVTNGLLINNVSAYVENCTFIGGSRCWSMTDGNVFTGVGCEFLYGETGCYRAVSVADGALINCVTNGSWSDDGASYDNLGNHLELRHRSWRNGLTATGISNGSSAHGATVIRLSGHYGDSDGPNVADVVDSKSFLAGCIMEGNRAASTSQQVNFANDGLNSSATAWLLECGFGGTGIAHDLRAIDAADRIYVRRSPYVGSSGSGQIGAW